MKHLTFVFSFVLATMAYGQTISTITCKVNEVIDNKKVEVKVEFLVKDLGSKKAQLLEHPKAQDDMGAILVSPQEIHGQYVNMTHLNGQGGDLRVSEDKIRLFGDGAGYTFVDLVLFKDSGFTKGFVRVSGSGDQMYQKLSCKVK